MPRKMFIKAAVIVGMNLVTVGGNLLPQKECL